MASYPTFPQLLGSDHLQFDDMTVDRAIDGSGRGRAFYDTRKAGFVVRHNLTNAQRDTLLAFYDANRTIPFDLLWTADSVTYTSLAFTGPPKFSGISNGRYLAEVSIVAL